MPQPLRFTKEEVAEALTKAYGVIAVAAESLKTSRKTVYEYIARYPSLKAYLDDGREYGLDIAEASLMKQIVKGDTAATIFFLKTQGRKRGYTEKIEVWNYDVPQDVVKQAIEALEDAGIDATEFFTRAKLQAESKRSRD